jgi:hypothetical protein
MNEKNQLTNKDFFKGLWGAVFGEPDNEGNTERVPRTDESVAGKSGKETKNGKEKEDDSEEDHEAPSIETTGEEVPEDLHGVHDGRKAPKASR